jgi:hypothetical protein
MPAAAGKLRQGKQSESRAEQGGAKQHLLLHDGRALDVKIKMSQFFTHVQSEMGLWSRPPGNSLSEGVLQNWMREEQLLVLSIWYLAKNADSRPEQQARGDGQNQDETS